MIMSNLDVLTTKVDIKSCARCGKDHEQVLFVKFLRNPVPGFTRWGTCPLTGEPIMMRVVEDGDVKVLSQQ